MSGCPCVTRAYAGWNFLQENRLHPLKIFASEHYSELEQRSCHSDPNGCQHPVPAAVPDLLLMETAESPAGDQSLLG